MASLPETHRRIGRFDVLKPLGRGTQGSVWLAHDPELQRDVAIKTVEVDGGAARTLLDEAVMASRLVHPNIVTLFDAARDDGKPYLVFEYVAGRTLATVIRDDGRIAAPRACALAIQILRGVEMAHEKGVLHRDLKPANVMVTDEGVARIMDFGIASLASAAGAEEDGFHGTPAYTAPEYVSRREFQPASDVFAVGAMLFEMLTGAQLVQGKTVYEVLHKLANVPFPRASQLAEAIDETLDAIVDKAVAKDPAQRYPSAVAMIEALEDYLKPSDGEAPDGSVTDSTLEFLLRRMRLKNDFPALSSTVTSVTRAVASDKHGIPSLAGSILKDFATTNKLLRMVNAAQYGKLGRGVSTVSRAIMVMGFDQVRAIAVSLMLFEHMQNKSQASTLRDEIISAYFGALLARSLAGASGLRDSEEAFICAMFNSLGRLLTSFYFHEEFAEIQKQAASGRPERDAAVDVLGTSLEELGLGVAKYWNFPEKVVASMEAAAGPAPTTPPATEEDRLRLLVSMVRAITDTIRYTPASRRQQKMMEIEQRYGQVLGVDQTRVLTAVAKSIEGVTLDAKTLGMRTEGSTFFAQANGWTKHFAAAGAGAAAAGRSTAVAGTIEGTVLDGRAFEEEAAGSSGDVAQDRKNALAAGIQDIGSVLTGSYRLNDVLKMIVETMFRGVGFSRALLLVRDGASNSLKTRLGLGDDIDRILREGFAVPLTPAKDVFHAAISQGVDIYIEDVQAPKIRSHIPQWYRERMKSRSIALFPVVVNRKPVALLYGDSDESGKLSFSSEELSLLKTLRDQAVLAIRSHNV